MAKTESLLRKGLLANAAFSGLSGLILLLFSSPLTVLLGAVPRGALLVVGGVLLLYSVDLWRTSQATPMPRGRIVYFIVMDVLWVVGSVLLVWGVALSFTTAGRWVVLMVADVVAVFAIVQYVGLRRVPPSKAEADVAPS